MTLTENAAYLKGLCEGLNLDETKPEGKMIAKLLALVSDMADEISSVKGETKELRDYVEEMDDDLSVVEEDLYGDDDEEDDDDDADDEDDKDDDDDDERSDEDFYEVTCPNCGESVCFDDSIDPEHLTCPACGTTFDCTCDGNCEGCSEEDCHKDDAE